MKTINESGLRLSKSAYTIEIELLEEALRNLKVGESISYDELGKIANMNIRENMSLLYKARNNLIDERIRTECIPGVAVKRLDDDQIVERAVAGRKSIYRKAKRERRKIEVADFTKIQSPDLKRRAPFEHAILGAIACMTDGRKIAAQIKGVTGSARELPKPDGLIEMMSN